MPELKHSINIIRLHLSVRYDTLLFPFDITEFARVLPDRGYVLSGGIPPAPVGARVSMSGPLARKGDSELRVNTERDVLAIQSRDIQSLVQDFDALEEFVKDEFQFDSKGHAHFYELIAELNIQGQKSPLESMQSLSAEDTLIQRFSDVIKRPARNFAVRLVPDPGNPFSTDWFDIRIEPNIPDFSRYFSVFIIFRDSVRDNVINFVRELPGTVDRLVSVLEA